MGNLAVIREVAETLLPSIMAYAAKDPQELYSLASTLGPIGGCHEPFSPLYMFDVCRASCSYCGFAKGSVPKPKVLSADETYREAMAIRAMGCRTAYVLGGSLTGWDAINSEKWSAQAHHAELGLLALDHAGLFPVLEMSPFSRYELQLLKQAIGRGRYVLFQETYDGERYRAIHQGEQTMRYKGTPEERFGQVSLALMSGWCEVGIGAILGLSPNLWQDVAAVIVHARWLLDEGAELVTISVPRLNPATGADTSARCSDDDFVRAVAIYSILGRAFAPGKVKIVITGRETAAMRDHLAPLTDIWGIRGSTTPGGYAVRPDAPGGQFDLVDRRTLAEIRSAHAARHP